MKDSRGLEPGFRGTLVHPMWDPVDFETSPLCIRQRRLAESWFESPGQAQLPAGFFFEPDLKTFWTALRILGMLGTSS